MTMLVTLEQARAHLRIDTADDEADLLLKIEAASELVLDYCKQMTNPTFVVLDSSGMVLNVDSSGVVLGVPKRVQDAALMLVGYLYRERDGSNDNAVPAQFGFGFLPVGVQARLYSLRRPTIA